MSTTNDEFSRVLSRLSQHYSLGVGQLRTTETRKESLFGFLAMKVSAWSITPVVLGHAVRC